MEEETRRGTVLTIFAALFALLALSDISKPFKEPLHRLIDSGTKESVELRMRR